MLVDELLDSFFETLLLAFEVGIAGALCCQLSTQVLELNLAGVFWQALENALQEVVQHGNIADERWSQSMLHLFTYL